MSMFISDAVASAQGASVVADGTPFGGIIMLVGFILIFYFLLWRPQSKRAKEHRALVASLDKGDEVITSGGVAGEVTRVTDNFIVLSIAEGIEINLQRSAVSATLPKGTIKGI